jgi:SAM-dependent methyltransferase
MHVKPKPEGVNGMNDATTAVNPVRALYEEHPYPNSVSSSTLIPDLANAIQYLHPQNDLEGRRILDAGCGTGQRLVALAKAFPKANFVGADFSVASLRTAEQVARYHAASNVMFMQCDLTRGIGQGFDGIVSTGVMHHLNDPEAGIARLSESLNENGFVFLWLYHRYGEFGRLLDRALARLLWEKSGSPGGHAKIALLQRLGLSLAVDRYGRATVPNLVDANQESIDIDAYLHPVVNAFSIGEVCEMLSRCEIDWVSPNGINMQQRSKLLDLGKTDNNSFLMVTAKDLFRDPVLQSEYEKMPPVERIKAAELVMKPTGFTILAGRGQGYLGFDKRVEQNIVWKR